MAILATIPAQYLEQLLLNAPTATTFQIQGVVYTRAQVLAAWQAIEDPSNVDAVGLWAISGQTLYQVTSPSQVY